MIKQVLPIIFFLFSVFKISGQNLNRSIDSLLISNNGQPFSGVILIAKGADEIYSNAWGFSEMRVQKTLTRKSQFVIGSLSKQLTAAMVLQAYDQGLLKLDLPIKKYLPLMSATWSDTVTIHHLLTHTHGIVALNEPLAFVPGTQFQYSQLGFELLANILESVTHQSFETLSNELFKKCNMMSSTHPFTKQLYMNVVKGYASVNTTSKLKPVSIEKSTENYAAAGCFVSNADDLVKWNQLLYGGKLLSDSAFKLMISIYPNAVRNHPLFGPTTYGYGTTITQKDGLLQIGQTGFAPGFISMNFYFPESKVSVIVLSNFAHDTEHLSNTFYYHLRILDLARNYIKAR
jgi:CubicO group peptidase (beta-lactamase class C family)